VCVRESVCEREREREGERECVFVCVRERGRGADKIIRGYALRPHPTQGYLVHKKLRPNPLHPTPHTPHPTPYTLHPAP